ncbi:nicotinate-nucleotide--dimethylbenzimidazole phosphoribosyltransferase [Streptomyces sp. P9-2]|uniref:nicotinate-nucleotide--dimethylbenzimidazole phosphoribosyltransferase n=1 Tax=Streptomyces sp. P9-2 TaxID=3423201 RepID=UPI003F74486C
MTDTGQVPGEGLPENAGRVEQPGVAAPDAYTYLSDSPAEDEDLLLPGAQGAWGNEIAPPAPAPVVETVHQPGPHETDGRDSGSVDLGGVRPPEPQPQPQAPAPAPSPAPAPPRRPLHLGPPLPDLSASPVRSLADRGPADLPARQPGPPTLGPEYLDVPRTREAAAPQAAPWVAQVPAAGPADPAQAAVARVATQAVGTAVAPEGEQTPAAAYGEQGTPVVPGQGVPGGVAAGGVTGGDAGASAPVDAAAVVPDADEAGDGGVPVAEGQGAEVPPAAHEPVADEPVAQEAQDADAAVVVPEQAQAPEGEAAQAAVADADVPQAATEETAGTPDAEAAAEVAQDAPVAEAVAPEAVQVAEAPEQPAPVQDVQDVQDVQAPEAPEPAPVREAVEPQDAQAPEAPPAEAPNTAVPAAEEPETVAAQAPDQAPADEQAPAPEAVAPAPEAVAPAPEAVAPAPEALAPAPEALAPASEAVAPAPEAVAPTAELVPDVAPAPAEPAAPEAVEPAPGPASAVEPPAASEPVQGPQQTPAHATPLPGTLPLEPEADQPLGQFVPVDGTVPTAPHLAPTPPQGVPVPEETAPEAPAVPDAPAADAELAQTPDDLDTQGAGVEPEPARQPEPAGPAAPGYADAEREAVLKVMRERRDIRNGFRGDPIPHEVLLRVLEAAHTAPSVGHSQPWDFVVIRSEETRRRMHELATRQREAYAKTLPKGRAKQFKELKIEAILDTPVNIVVTADPTRGGRHTLGRHTQPQMAPYSSALAVENLWLAARAEGLGVGWVSFFDEREMVRALDLPEHLEVVAYLCVGYVDEFPDEPELMQAGWSKRRPLSWVVHEETYGRRALPGEDPHDLLAETVAQIRPLDAKALGEAWERQKRMTKPAGALGMLEIISAQLSGLSRQCPPPIPEPAAVAIFAGDHGVHAQGVTPWPQEVTAQMVANFLGGGAVCNAFAAQVGAEVCVVDVGVSSDLPATPGLLPRKIRAGTSDMTAGPAMTREEAKQAIEVGIETARDLVAAGNKALLTGEMGIANTTASAALISVYTGADPAEVTGRGTGINDETLARKTDVVRRALDLHQPDPSDPLGVLAAVGGFEHAAMVGLLLGGASLRTPVILDGVSAGAAALVARAIAPEVLAACIAGHRSAEPGHVAALNKLGLRPLVDLDLRLGEGTGALLALPLVQSTARAMHEVATFDSAGVTEK